MCGLQSAPFDPLHQTLLQTQGTSVNYQLKLMNGITKPQRKLTIGPDISAQKDV